MKDYNILSHYNLHVYCASHSLKKKGNENSNNKIGGKVNDSYTNKVVHIKKNNLLIILRAKYFNYN
jgi:hypothetical protein